jgi:hypothetical protein
VFKRRSPFLSFSAPTAKNQQRVLCNVEGVSIRKLTDNQVVRESKKGRQFGCQEYRRPTFD